MMPLSNVVSGQRDDGAADRSVTTTCSGRPRSTARRRPGYSSGAGARRRWSSCRSATLPQGMTFEWSGSRSRSSKAGGSRVLIFGLGLLLVYLTLAAQYESLVAAVHHPAVGAAGHSRRAASRSGAAGCINDVYCQIGLVMLIGLSAKNAILDRRVRRAAARRGLSIVDAAIEAARIRLRPILMTSLAFILGVLPLVFASGAGRAARNSVGTAVVGGMLVSTFLNLVFIPVLYIVVKTAPRSCGAAPR